MRAKRAVAVGGIVAALVTAAPVGAYGAERSDPTPFIIGGREVSSAPWAAQIVGVGCSGSIIGARWVLSAWHCVDDDPSRAQRVRVGDVRRGQGQEAGVRQVHHRHDILLVELDRDISTTYAKVADVDPPVGAPVDVYGWGGTCEEGCGMSPVLKTARMRVESVVSGGDGERMVRTEQVGDGYAWYGDSGGPAFWNGMQIGTLCCGNTSGDGSGTESYSSLANVKDWIWDITGIAPGGGPGSANLALNRPTRASDPCTDQETGDKAVNGSVSGGLSDKWCSGASGTKSLDVDLGEPKDVQRVVVRHAGAGGEVAEYNTRNFRIETSTDGDSWQTAATVTDNTAADTSHAVSGPARWVRLAVDDSVARIYELEVY
jgi:hypothetical protein